MRFPFKLSTDKQFDCAGFGENTGDYLLLAPEFPETDTKHALLEDVQTSGGQVASALVGLARLGLKTTYAGRFGADEAGRRGRESLIRAGVDVSFAETIEAARTHTSYILIDAVTGNRTILFSRDERLGYDEQDAPLPIANLARAIHIDGQNPRAALRLIDEAHKAHAIISADFDFVNDDIIGLLPHIDIMIASRDFLAQATNIADERQALKTLQARYGCPLVGLTRGENGSLLFIENGFIEQSALPVAVRDTTGAGDAFRAGFLYGLSRDETIEDAMNIAAAVAALSCRSLGARDGLPTKRELDDYLTHI